MFSYRFLHMADQQKFIFISFLRTLGAVYKTYQEGWLRDGWRERESTLALMMMMMMASCFEILKLSIFMISIFLLKVFCICFVVGFIEIFYSETLTLVSTKLPSFILAVVLDSLFTPPINIRASRYEYILFLSCPLNFFNEPVPQCFEMTWRTVNLGLFKYFDIVIYLFSAISSSIIFFLTSEP